MLKNLSIQTISSKAEIIWGLPAYIGEIRLGDFHEKIYIPVAFWTIDEYANQWQEGLGRIESENKSCLVATVQGDDQTPTLIDWWILHKKGHTVTIENCILVGDILKKTLKGENFTPDNCYNYIPRLSRKKEVSKWIVEI